MHHSDSQNTDAFTGLEAAIVLIAFVVVAAVFSYVVLGAGYYTTQKSQETVYKSVEQATSNIQVTGQLYGIDSSAVNKIDILEFTVTLAPGAPSMDLTRMSILFSSDIVSPITYSYGTTADTSHFSAVNAKTDETATAVTAGDQIRIKFILAESSQLSANQKFNIEVRPSLGSSFTISRSVGAMVFKNNIM
jgi:flagellin FlaB